MIGFLAIVIVAISATAVSPSGLTSRIVGGSPVLTIEEVPYQVSILLNGNHYCGGIIISELYVLTAAACVSAGSVSQYSIKSGTADLNRGGAIHLIYQIIKHPNYYVNNNNIPVNDIALIQLRIAFNFDGSRDAVPLLSKQPARENSIAKISGWGWMNSTFPSQLQKTSVKIINTSYCSNTFYQGQIPPGQMCAFTRGQDACNADAGGPLVVGVHLAGIISWGKGCALNNYPGVYTDVYYYRNWITRNTGALNL